MIQVRQPLETLSPNVDFEYAERQFWSLTWRPSSSRHDAEPICCFPPQVQRVKWQRTVVGIMASRNPVGAQKKWHASQFRLPASRFVALDGLIYFEDHIVALYDSKNLLCRCITSKNMIVRLDVEKSCRFWCWC